MRTGSHFDGEIFDATYTNHKTFEELEGSPRGMALGTSPGAERMFIDVRRPASRRGSASPAPHWITHRRTNVF